MIKNLRRKFVIIMMSPVVLILLLLFLAMLLSTQSNFEKNSMELLHQSLQDRARHEIINGPDQPPGRPRPAFRMPALVLEIKEGNGHTVLMNQLYYTDSADISELAVLAYESSDISGELKNHSLRYLKKETDTATYIAFVDTSVETLLIRNLVVNSLAIGGAALLAFFILSIFLSRWAVKPVERAWNHQRQFVADASHELKTPLTTILANADMLSSSNAFSDNTDARRMENIRAEGLRMKLLIEDMLTLAKSDNMGKTTPFSQVCLSDIIMDSVLLFAPAVYDEGKHLNYNIRQNVMVWGDGGRLRQLIDILLDNANKYTDKGGHIDVEMEISSKKAILISVTNEGELLTRDQLERIFERFYRIDEARENNGGFGLGLSIAQTIVSEHNGRIWAENSGDHGNVFQVLLPQINDKKTSHQQ